MFTGMIEALGTVVEIVPRRGSKRIGIDAPLPEEGTRPGESLAVDGVCLTVTDRGPGTVYADAVTETLSRSTLGSVRTGTKVNLERAIRVGDRLGGHWILGHVDTVARVRSVARSGDDWRLVIELPTDLRPYVAPKGSIALQGVSLTVARVDRDGLEVALVPETLRRTTLGSLRSGARVNVEADLLARYLEVLIGATASRLAAKGTRGRGTGTRR
jgi:riboflavin synthase